MKRIHKILLFLSLVSSVQLFAQDVPEKFINSTWPASWISVPDTDSEAYGVYYFRKTFDLKDIPKEFEIYVSADNRYKLFVNEKWIGTGPSKSDLAHYRFDIHDLAPFLHKGKNVIAVQVWNEADYRPEFQFTYQTGLIVQGKDELSEIVNSDRKWLCIKDDSYEPTLTNNWKRSLPFEKSRIPGYYVAGPGEKIDFKKSIQNWQSIEYDDSEWSKARTSSRGLPKNSIGLDGGNSWRLTPSPIPQMVLEPQHFLKTIHREGQEISSDFLQSEPVTIEANQEVVFLLDQGKLTNAYPYLSFSKGKGSRIDLTYAEALMNKNNKGHRNEIEGKEIAGRFDVLLPDGKANVFTPMAYRTFRYIEVKITTKDEPLELNEISSVFTGYPFQMKSQLSGISDEMQEILDIGFHTARLCANETYMDCPYYEQLQYIGDTRIQAMVSLYSTGDERLMKNAINMIHYSQQPEGITASRYPTFNQQVIPTFSLWYIGMLNDYLKYVDDPDFVKQKLFSIRQVLAYYENFRDKDGLVKNLPNWFFADWVDHWTRGMPPLGNDGSSSVIDLQLLLAYQYAAEIELAVGLPSLGHIYLEEAAKLKKSIRKKYWDSSRGYLADTPEKDKFSQHANSLAILAELIRPEEYDHITDALLHDASLEPASIYFKYYLHLALTKTGLGNDYLNWLTVWREHMAAGLTTWAEDTDANTTRSDCHAWGASPNIEFYRILLGIDSDSPGFAKVKIEPHLGDLEDVSGSIPHPKGEISCAYTKQNNGNWKVKISLPPSITGRLIFKGQNLVLNSGTNEFEIH